MVKAVKEAMSKTAILAACAEETGFTKKECGQVLDALSGTIEGHEHFHFPFPLARLPLPRPSPSLSNNI